MFKSRRSTNEKSKIRIHQISFGDSRLYEKISKRSIAQNVSFEVRIINYVSPLKLPVLNNNKQPNVTFILIYYL